MTGQLIYVIGQPGAGKTTAMRALTASRTRTVERRPGLAWTRLDPITTPPDDGLPARTVELGYDRDTFGGTDALGMSVQPHAIEWMADGADGADLVLAEGDRLATDGFLLAAVEAGWAVTVAFLMVADIKGHVCPGSTEKLFVDQEVINIFPDMD